MAMRPAHRCRSAHWAYWDRDLCSFKAIQAQILGRGGHVTPLGQAPTQARVGGIPWP